MVEHFYVCLRRRVKSARFAPLGSGALMFVVVYGRDGVWAKQVWSIKEKFGKTGGVVRYQIHNLKGDCRCLFAV